MQPEKSMPGVLVISRHASEYAAHLKPLQQSGVAVTFISDGGAVRHVMTEPLVVLGDPALVADALPALPGVRWVQSTWAGVTPLLAQGAGHFRLTGVKDVFGPQMAEYVLAYLLVRELNVIGRFEQQRARQWDDRLIGRLHGRSLGVMGTGSIGQAIGRAASALGMRVTGYSRRGRPVEPFRQVYAETELATFLSQCDAVAAVLPDTPATRGLMNERAFAAMPTGSYFINVGRGSLVDENALVKAVCDGRLAGAALDVFRTEPLPQNSPLWDTPGILVTAHVAAHSYPGDIAALFLRNYHRFREGRPLLYEIDFKQGY